MEAIILAGGPGTRLREAVPDMPKCMAPVNGEPFLSYILSGLEEQGFDHVVLSLGYKHEAVIDWLRNKAFLFKVSWVIEKEPLGTGGGIKLALNKSKESPVFILNGDTLFKADLAAMRNRLDDESEAILALKPMQHFDRYGSVQLDEHRHITAFREKQPMQEGLINGGIYLLNKRKQDLKSFPDRFSFEKDFLEKAVAGKKLQGFVSDGYFIDIGIPEDYNRAQSELKI